MNGGPDAGQTVDAAMRIDRWLWFARFFKSRTLASRLCASGKLRLNSRPLAKAHATCRAGDVLTFPKGPRIRVIRVVALGARRGPATEARALYEDLEPPQDTRAASVKGPPTAGRRERGAGRPTKAHRRAIDRLRDGG